MKVFDLLRRGAADYPNAIAVEHGERKITYRELIESVAILAKYLRQLDMPANARVAVLCENSIEYVIFFFAVLSADYVAVPLDTSLKSDKFRFILKDCNACALLVQTKYLRFSDDLMGADSPVQHAIAEKSVNAERVGFPVASLPDILEDFRRIRLAEIVADIDQVAPADKLRHDTMPDCPHELAAIFYTSGSTGSPKGVMLSHLNLVSNTIATVEYLRLTHDDSIMVILPFYYIYGNSLLLTHVQVGGRCVIDNRFAFPQVILQTMIQKRTTGFSGVPSNFMILLNNANFRADKLPDLRYITQAGGGMAPEVIRRVMDALAGKEIFIMYGQTEAAPRVTWLPPERLPEKVGSIGIPVPGVTITVGDESGNEMPTGEVGEIVVSGPNVMLGYWNNSADEEGVLRNGRLFTGDLARRDEEGYIYVVSRKKEIMKVGGNRVSAKEIEERILENENILEAAVFPVKDDILGEAITAAIVLKTGCALTEKEVQDHCKQRLAIHKAPKHVRFYEALPKYQSGKVNKLALAEEFRL
ncbi:MAG: acyl--CoA ligase [candidate division Zixibacteria bacterium]|nr:acyl--CoA ligase [candidate division Zixibacteria bacterium]